MDTTTTRATAPTALVTGGSSGLAVGTTVTRAPESAVHDGAIAPSPGWTERIVTPAHPPEVVDGLVTGWHDAGASQLLLVGAVAGTALAQTAYDAVVAERYHRHELGDSALLLPPRG